ncbi:MAG: response regulator, partial [Anaerolineae bacterium]
MPKQQSPLQLKGNIQLLVVDTDLRIRSALVRALNLIGYAAEGVSSGREALALLECRKRDLMIIDILLLDLNGVEVVKRARRRWPELQVIILTRQATLESAIAGVQLQVADYLIKPVNTRQILTAVSKALEERNRQ